MNRPTTTHPHRNHLIWLRCARTIAFCARTYSVGPLTKNNRPGPSLGPSLPSRPTNPRDEADREARMLANTASSIVTGASKTETYFRTSAVDVSVYSVTGQAQPA